MKALTGIKLIDGISEQPIQKATIVIDDSGTISSVGNADDVQIPKEAEVVDCTGKTVMPGLIDAHVHLCFEPCADPFSVLINERDGKTALKAANYARKALEIGVTTIRDMGGKNYVDLDLRDSFAKGAPIGPRVLASGKILTMTGGHGWPVGEEIDGAQEARKGARKQLKQGVDQVKIMATGGVMTQGVEPGSPQLTEEEMAAAIEEAHKAGRKTATHAQGTTGIKNAVKARIDSIEHGIFLDDETIKMMKENNVFLVPTLAAPHWISEKGREAGIPEHAVAKSDAIKNDHVKSFQMAYEAGVNIAMGTDAGTPFNEHGKNSFELALMVKNGMKTMDAIKAATAKGAELLGISDQVGTLSAGKQADLLILDKDPLEDIDNINKVNSVYKDGQKIDL